MIKNKRQIIVSRPSFDKNKKHSPALKLFKNTKLNQLQKQQLALLNNNQGKSQRKSQRNNNYNQGSKQKDHLQKYSQEAYFQGDEQQNIQIKSMKFKQKEKEIHSKKVLEELQIEKQRQNQTNQKSAKHSQSKNYFKKNNQRLKRKNNSKPELNIHARKSISSQDHLHLKQYNVLSKNSVTNHIAQPLKKLQLDLNMFVKSSRQKLKSYTQNSPRKGARDQPKQQNPRAVYYGEKISTINQQKIIKGRMNDNTKVLPYRFNL